jgi:hypothetical protein
VTTSYFRQLTGRLGVAAAVVLAITAAFSAPPAVTFVDAFRTPSTSYFLTPIGEIYFAARGQSPKKLLVLHYANNLPYRWPKNPASFAQWRSEWLVANGANQLVRFTHDGMFTGFVELPIRSPKVAVTNDAIWITNLLAGNVARQLWRSTDGHTFVGQTEGASQARFTSPAKNLLVLAAGADGDVYVAAIIGPPVVRRVWPPNRRAEIRIAGSRSKMRAAMEEIYGVVDDVTDYSLPLRDLLPLPDGGFAVLRNREDVRGSTGKLELLKGQRADRYDRGGHQLATAVFPRSAHWLTAVTSTKVIGVSNAGEIVEATWGKAIPEEILPP